MFAPLAFLLVATALAGRGQDTLPPPPGLVCAGQVVNVVDGDTLDVELKIRVRIRLLECWAPESRTKNEREKLRGIAAKEHLEKLADEQPCIVGIPWQSERLQDSISLGRVLGHVWIRNKSLAKEQVAGGFASTEKNRPLGR